ncbi:TetR/AcrR family transcriptional regulator [Paludibacterium purpuratum]|uniref:TetR/AcrR family transcriptional regulator n=1 Tax=Paludibacterium purpuratum TaxID=1144873 RepID=UPI001AAD7164|nr:TetR/AcrR family transcriptional regulator [Paludibacterium purpuratum]
MNRTSSTRQLLLGVGMQMAREGGLRGLTVRGLAARAGVNPGGFVYHFGSRDAFLSELIETWYQPLFAQLQWHQEEGEPPLSRLRAMLLQLVGFMVEHRAFVAHLLQDVAAGEPAAIAFVHTMEARHPLLLLQVIREAQAAGVLVRADPLHQMMFIMATLGGPLLLAQMLAGMPALPEAWVRIEAQFALDGAAIEQRLDWALKGLQP